MERVTTVADSSAGSTTAALDPTSIRGPGAVEANAVVTAQVDGDTIRVTLSNNAQETIRLIGIDTPETKRPGSPIDCFGPEASNFLAELAPIGTPVTLELDVEERDRYGRLLAYIRRSEDGLFLNETIVRFGYAQILTYPPNVAYTDRFLDAVELARNEQRGLWGQCDANP